MAINQIRCQAFRPPAGYTKALCQRLMHCQLRISCTKPYLLANIGDNASPWGTGGGYGDKIGAFLMESRLLSG